MSDERPDEFFSWRSRLGPPDALPEQGLDNRDLTWEKLAHRLEKTAGRTPRSLGIPGQSSRHPSGSHASANSAFARLRPARLQTTRRRFPAYRIAAACLLLLLIPAARLFHNHPTQTPHQSGAVASRPSTPHTPQPTEIDPPLLQSGPTPKELTRLQGMNNNKTRSAKASMYNRFPHTPAAIPQDSLSSPAPIGAGVQPVPPVQISALTRSPETAPSPASPQNTLKTKQLRVVHINDLDNPGRPEPSMTSIPGREPDIRVLIILKNH